MKYVLTLTLALTLMLYGCGKSNNASPAAPGHASNDNSGTAGNPNAGTGGTGTDAKQPASGNTGGKTDAPAEKLPVITQEQFDKIDINTTVEGLNKLAGAPGKVIADTGDRKTYQYQLKGKDKYYANVVFNKGQFLEKSIFMM